MLFCELCNKNSLVSLKNSYDHSTYCARCAEKRLSSTSFSLQAYSIQCCSLPELQACLEKDKQTFEKSEYERLLFYSAHKGRKDLATTLLNHGIDPNATILGRNSLIGASETGVEELVRVLLKFGADLNASDFEGNTPLMFACGGGFYNIAQMLLKQGATVDARNKQGSTAFLLSCITGQKSIVKLLLAYGADFRLTNFKGQTPLMLASFYGRAQILKMLLSKTGLDVNAKDVHEDTALIFAAQRGQQDICQLLIEAGARASDTNKYNHSAKTYFASARMEFKYNDNVATLFRTVYA